MARRFCCFGWAEQQKRRTFDDHAQWGRPGAVKERWNRLPKNGLLPWQTDPNPSMPNRPTRSRWSREHHAVDRQDPPRPVGSAVNATSAFWSAITGVALGASPGAVTPQSVMTWTGSALLASCA
jgi:hypothetical protein